MPTRAAAAGLEIADADASNLVAVVLNREPGTELGAKAWFALAHSTALALLHRLIANRWAFAAGPGTPSGAAPARPACAGSR